MKSWKTIALIVGCLVIVTWSFVLFTQRTASEPPVQMVMGPFSAHYIVTYALENDLLKPHCDIETKIEYSLNFNEHMMTGSGDMGEMSTAAFAIAYEKDIPLKATHIFVMHQGMERADGVAMVFARKESDIEKPEDLVGKKVGVPGLKTTTATIFLEMLRREYGVEEDELKLIDKPLTTLPGLLEKGDIDVALMFGEVSVKSFYSDKYKLVWNVDETFKQEYGVYPPASLLVARSDFLEKHEDRARKVVATLRQSKSYGETEEHMDEILRWYADKFGGELDIYKKAYCYHYCIPISPITDENKGAVMAVFEFVKARGLITKVPEPEEVFASIVL
jgi:ABC-type nitrate/sulfonate/bicarbonate transport system substrate-binding protein